MEPGVAARGVQKAASAEIIVVGATVVRVSVVGIYFP